MIKLKKILKENNLHEAFADSTELQTTISYLKSKNKVLDLIRNQVSRILEC